MKNFSVESLFRQKHIEGEKKDILQKVRVLQIYEEHTLPA